VSIPVVLTAAVAASRLGLPFDVVRGGGLVLGLALTGSLAARLATRCCATDLRRAAGAT
jgi:hypothetical protein